MNLAFFIARRTARPASSKKPGVMERIAVLSVALSVGTMILALAVMMGFKREVTRKITGFAAHATLTDVRSVHALNSVPVRRSEYLESLIRSTEGFVSMAPYALRGGIVRTDDAVEGIVLKGVDASYDWRFFAEWLTQGSLPRVGDSIRTKEILLSQNLSRRLKLGVGDRVEMLFVEQDEMPRRDRFKISGIYASGMDEMDNTLVMTDLRNVQRLSDRAPEEITGYEIFTRSLAASGDFVRRLDRALLHDESGETDNLVVQSVEMQHANIFDWLKAHDVNAAVIIVIMLLVAFFNMTSALLILVMERTRMIGLLKALGMRNGTLRRIFLYRAAFVALRGMAWGNAAGLALCLLQQRTGAVKLDAEGYLLSEVPVAVEWSWWLLLNAGVLATIVLLLVIPASVVSRIRPEEAIRYER
ncbi:MAG: ABC transporter permease [Alistipes sp.]|nr:ABC transporter permease [Alistipes senegalensis]MCM1250574.1 ABC transporter permease [Alistipes sp.]